MRNRGVASNGGTPIFSYPDVLDENKKSEPLFRRETAHCSYTFLLSS